MNSQTFQILLVEDDDGHASLVRRNLMRAAIANDIVRLRDGQEALDFVHRQGPYADREANGPLLLLLDINMPYVDGITVLSAIKSNAATARIPVIMLTTTDDPREIDRCYAAGCSLYVSKPVEYERFIEVVNRLGLFLQIVAAPRTEAGPPAPACCGISQNGAFDGVLCLARGVAAHAESEQATVGTQDRFELAIRGSNDGLGDWNLETGECSWSPRLHEMLGYTHTEFGDGFTSISSKMHPDDRDRVLEEIVEGTRLHQGVNSEFRLLTKSGKYLWVQGRGQAVYDASGKPTRFAGALTDISERKQMEANLAQRDEQLRQSHKLEAIGSLAGGISHEFNNLIQVIRGYGQYAMQGLSPEDQRYQDLGQVVAAADRAASLTRQLLGFSRLQVLEQISFDHREVVKDLAKLLRPLIGEHIELDVRLVSDVGSIHADRGLVQQMLLNLCINARDSMPSGGRLSIKTECVVLSDRYCQFHPGTKPGSYVVFSVADTGCGMPPEVTKRIFEPFFTTKEVGKGTGLGLAMVYGCVQQHGGMINVYSEVGLGTTFKIYLPLAAPIDLDNVKEPAAAPERGSETILIAEDESMVRDLAVRILESAGYSVLVAADGAEAVELFEAHSDTISLALFDAIMPKMTGRQAYERIKLTHPDLPAIFCSGYDPETIQVKSLTDKGCLLVRKPYDPDVLLKSVRTVLDKSYSQRAPLCIA